MYRKEVEQNQIRLEKLRADGAEEWDIKNTVCMHGTHPSRSNSNL